MLGTARAKKGEYQQKMNGGHLSQDTRQQSFFFQQHVSNNAPGRPLPIVLLLASPIDGADWTRTTTGSDVAAEESVEREYGNVLAGGLCLRRSMRNHRVMRSVRPEESVVTAARPVPACAGKPSPPPLDDQVHEPLELNPWQRGPVIEQISDRVLILVN